MDKIRGIGAFFEALFRGDAVAVGFLLGFLALAALAFFFVWLINARMKADDKRYREELRKKGGIERKGECPAGRGVKGGPAEHSRTSFRPDLAGPFGWPKGTGPRTERLPDPPSLRCVHPRRPLSAL